MFRIGISFCFGGKSEIKERITTDLHWKSVGEIAAEVRSGDLTEVDIAEHFIERVEKVNPDLNVIVQFDRASYPGSTRW